MHLSFFNSFNMLTFIKKKFEMPYVHVHQVLFLSQFFAGSAITGRNILRGKKEFTGLKARREERRAITTKKKETLYTQQLWGKTLAPTIQLKERWSSPLLTTISTHPQLTHKDSPVRLRAPQRHEHCVLSKLAKSPR